MPAGDPNQIDLLEFVRLNDERSTIIIKFNRTVKYFIPSIPCILLYNLAFHSACSKMDENARLSAGKLTQPGSLHGSSVLWLTIADQSHSILFYSFPIYARGLIIGVPAVYKARQASIRVLLIFQRSRVPGDERQSTMPGKIS